MYLLQWWIQIWHCNNGIHFEGQNLDDEDEGGCGEDSREAAGKCLIKKAPGASSVKAAFAFF